MLAHRRRRWASIKLTQGQRLVLDGHTDGTDLALSTFDVQQIVGLSSCFIDHHVSVL